MPEKSLEKRVAERPTDQALRLLAVEIEQLNEVIMEHRDAINDMDKILNTLHASTEGE